MGTAPPVRTDGSRLKPRILEDASDLLQQEEFARGGAGYLLSRAHRALRAVPGRREAPRACVVCAQGNSERRLSSVHLATNTARPKANTTQRRVHTATPASRVTAAPCVKGNAFSRGAIQRRADNPAPREKTCLLPVTARNCKFIFQSYGFPPANLQRWVLG